MAEKGQTQMAVDTRTPQRIHRPAGIGNRLGHQRAKEQLIQ